MYSILFEKVNNSFIKIIHKLIFNVDVEIYYM